MQPTIAANGPNRDVLPWSNVKSVGQTSIEDQSSFWDGDGLSPRLSRNRQSCLGEQPRDGHQSPVRPSLERAGQVQNGLDEMDSRGAT